VAVCGGAQREPWWQVLGCGAPCAGFDGRRPARRRIARAAHISCCRGRRWRGGLGELA